MQRILEYPTKALNNWMDTWFVLQIPFDCRIIDTFYPLTEYKNGYKFAFFTLLRIAYAGEPPGLFFLITSSNISRVILLIYPWVSIMYRPSENVFSNLANLNLKASGHIYSKETLIAVADVAP